MSDLKKYEGVIPAFYACYDDQGEISPERVRALVEYFYRERCAGLVCQRILWRMYLPERGRSQADLGRSDGSS